MARAEKSAELAPVVADLCSFGNAAEMGATRAHHQPFGFLDAVFIGLRLAQAGDIDFFCRLNLFLRPAAHEIWPFSPFHDDCLSGFD